MSKHITIVTDKVNVSGNTFYIRLPDGYAEHMRALLAKRGGFIHASFGTPQVSKSTGDRSQNSLIHGACESIAEQLGYFTEMSRAKAVEYVKNAMKRMAVGERGYPTVMNDIDGHEEPMSLAHASSEQAKMVIDTILDYCSLQELWLIRYNEKNEPEKYRVDTGEVIE